MGLRWHSVDVREGVGDRRWGATEAAVYFSVYKQVWISEGQADAVIQARGDSGTPKSGGIRVAAHDGGSEEAAKISLIC